ncbi:MAG: hypothetical protein M5R36_18535 [Deltaproteobacteria bacterium]|nr:hypothetical protein [Deltaproteobacteria bacterium]
MRNPTWILLLVLIIATALVVACGGGGDDDDDNDDAAGDDDTASGDDDDAADDDVDDDLDDDDGGGDDDATGQCPDGPDAVDLCNPQYDQDVPYDDVRISWVIPFAVDFSGEIMSGYQLVLDCSSEGEDPHPINLAAAVGATGGTIPTQFEIPAKQLGPFFGGETITCPVYIADGSAETVSNELSITLNLGEKT